MSTPNWACARIGLACVAGCLLAAGAALSQDQAAEPMDTTEPAADAGPTTEPAAGTGTGTADAGAETGTTAAPAEAGAAPAEDGTEASGTAAGSEEADAAAGAGSDADLAAVMAAGEEGYLANCRPCHGTNGTAGVPLAGNEKVASFDWLVHAILTGPGYMPGFADALSDEQIAEISTYVMNSWGNEFGPVTPEDAASVREATQ